MICDTLLNYLGFSEAFKIHTNDIVFQLGVVIIQKGKSIDLYSRKMTDAQQWYKVIERQLLIIVGNLK